MRTIYIIGVDRNRVGKDLIMKQMETVSDVNTLLSLIFNCDGCVIDNNYLLYPSELEDGYDDSNENVLGFYMNDDYTEQVLEVSMNGLIGSEINSDGLLVLPNNQSIQLLTNKSISNSQF